MIKTVGMTLLFVGAAAVAVAAVPDVPEIDSRSAATGLILLSGALLVIKSRRKR